VCVCLWENDLRYDDPLRRFLKRFVVLVNDPMEVQE
jgi:hypothetical protein